MEMATTTITIILPNLIPWIQWVVAVVAMVKCTRVVVVTMVIRRWKGRCVRSSWQVSLINWLFPPSYLVRRKWIMKVYHLIKYYLSLFIPTLYCKRIYLCEEIRMKNWFLLFLFLFFFSGKFDSALLQILFMIIFCDGKKVLITSPMM